MVIADSHQEDELFLVYGHLQKIAKYTTGGEKRWEKEVPDTPEMDSLKANYFETAEENLTGDRYQIEYITPRMYVMGVSGPDGHLYLALGKNYFSDPDNHLRIHEFDEEGELIRRYKAISEETSLPTIFDIDPEGGQLFVVTRDAEIREYKMP